MLRRCTIIFDEWLLQIYLNEELYPCYFLCTYSLPLAYKRVHEFVDDVMLAIVVPLAALALQLPHHLLFLDMASLRATPAHPLSFHLPLSLWTSAFPLSFSCCLPSLSLSFPWLSRNLFSFPSSLSWLASCRRWTCAPPPLCPAQASWALRRRAAKSAWQIVTSKILIWISEKNFFKV